MTSDPAESSPVADDEQPPYSDDDAPPADNVRPLTGRTEPAHLAAERALLGSLIYDPDQFDAAAAILGPADFDEPKHQTIWDAMTAVADREGHPPVHTLVLAELKRAGHLAKVASILPQLPGDYPDLAVQYAAIVHEEADGRFVANELRHGLAEITNRGTGNLVDVSGRVMDALDQAFKFVGPTAASNIPTIDELLAGDEDPYHWVIPGLIEHQERIILTAEPGAGKTTLLRQIALTAASGIHPFTLDPIEPITVLHVDVENSRRQNRRLYGAMRTKAGKDLKPENLRIEIRIEGLDLTTGEDQAWLNHRVKTVKPDLLLIGPIYKLANGDPIEEKSSKPVAMFLDRLRADHDCAIILEGHSAKAPVTDAKNRKPPQEPYGWSGWMRWPEIGIWLAKEGDLKHWRGAREERSWPTHLRRGGHWPWTPELDGSDQVYKDARQARIKAGHRITIREVADALNTPTTSIQRVLGTGSRHALAWTAFNESTLQGDATK